MKRIVWSLCALLLLSTAAVYGQEDDAACPALVEAISEGLAVCAETGPGEACLVSVPAEVTARAADETLTFAEAGDRVDLSAVGDVIVSGAGVDGWGAVWMQIDARRTDGPVVMGLLLGPARIFNRADAPDGEMQSFFLSAGPQTDPCADFLPGGLLVRVPDDETVTLNVNGAVFRTDGTVYIAIDDTAPPRMIVSILEGQLTVTVGAANVSLSNQRLEIPLNEEYEVVGVLAGTNPFSRDEFADLLDALPRPDTGIVAVPRSGQWTVSYGRPTFEGDCSPRLRENIITGSYRQQTGPLNWSEPFGPDALRAAFLIPDTVTVSEPEPGVVRTEQTGDRQAQVIDYRLINENRIEGTVTVTVANVCTYTLVTVLEYQDN